MKLKRKLGLACALALGTVASVATIGFTTVSCSSGDSLDYTSPNYKPSAAIASEFTSRDFNKIEQNIPWLEKQEKDELSKKGITNANVEMKVSLDDTHFIQTTNITGVMPPYSRMSAPNVPVTITNTLDINLDPNPSGQYEVQKSTSIMGQPVSQQPPEQWSRQQVEDKLQPLWQGPNDSSNQVPGNQSTGTVIYNPSSAIASQFPKSALETINKKIISANKIWFYQGRYDQFQGQQGDHKMLMEYSNQKLVTELNQQNQLIITFTCHLWTNEVKPQRPDCRMEGDITQKWTYDLLNPSLQIIFKTENVKSNMPDFVSQPEPDIKNYPLTSQELRTQLTQLYNTGKNEYVTDYSENIPGQPDNQPGNQPDNTPNPNYNPSYTIAQRLSLADFRIEGNMHKYAEFMKATIIQNGGSSSSVSVDCSVRLNGDHFILTTKMVQYSINSTTVTDICLTPNADETYTVKNTTTMDGHSQTMSQKVSYRLLVKQMEMLYTGDFGVINPPNNGHQPNYQPATPLPPESATGYNPSPRIRTKFSESAFNRIQSNLVKLSQQTNEQMNQNNRPGYDLTINMTCALSGDYFILKQNAFGSGARSQILTYIYLIPNENNMYLVTNKITSSGMVNQNTTAISYQMLSTQLEMYYYGDFPQMNPSNYLIDNKNKN